MAGLWRGNIMKMYLLDFIKDIFSQINFNVDKRKSHLSMLICSNQITKKDAEEEIDKNPPYSSDLLKKRR